jgi:subtilisin family serine protease
LFGCGGGGGGESDTTSPTAPSVDVESDNAVFDVPDNWQTDPSVWAANQEYENQPGLARVKAEEAYARGLTGDGQIIGFIDTGLDADHPEFDEKNIALNDRSGVSNTSHVQLSHGTGVASIALGARGSGGGLDVAPWQHGCADGE